MKLLLKIALFVTVIAVLPSEVRSEIILCNETEDTLEYSMVWDEGIPVFAPIWKTAGWYRLQPGSCLTRLRGNVRQELYLSVRRLLANGPFLAVYSLTERKYYTKGMYGIEDLFCVKPDVRKFERTVKHFEDLRECPIGWVLQTYNVMGFTTARTNLTMTFGD